MVTGHTVLAFESSCDETGVALVRVPVPGSGRPVLLAQTLHSQIALHQEFGGVVPELASRDHIRHAIPLLRRALVDAQCGLNDVDAIAYTRGPGLAGALLVGSGLACALAAALGRPVMGVHHLEGHLLSPFLTDAPPVFPFVALLVSGGHTQLMRVDAIGEYTLLGESIDDAAGEAFDKCAKLLGLPYPGGAALARMADFGDPTAFKLPRPLQHSGDLDFSFAGLKTAVRVQAERLARELGCTLDDLPDPLRVDLAASTQAAIVDVLVSKAVTAVKTTGCRQLVVAGGVGANRSLRSQLDAQAQRRGWRVSYPPLDLCSDNGAMIAMAAALRWQAGVQSPVADYRFEVLPRWPLASQADSVAR
jgi:N6-L-threonylcarbamoyladenine synthase